MKKKNLFKTNHLFGLLFIVLMVAFTTQVRATNYYVDATNGNDSNDGKSPATAWKTLTKVESSTFTAGDSILFKRGETFRGDCDVSNSGTLGSPIVYGAYGSGNKPLMLQSVNLNSTDDWTSLGSNQWASRDTFPNDVGFMLFGEEKPVNVGIKRKSSVNLVAAKEFKYDAANNRVVVYCTQNPASEYSSIEIARATHQNDHFINCSGKNYIHIDNLDIRYFNACGIAFSQCKGCEVRYCHISYGGGEQFPKWRIGNAIEIWQNARDHIIENNRFGYLYDSGVTQEGGGELVDNLIVRNNIFYGNDLAAYECGGYFGSTVTIDDIYFLNNVCVGNGWGWSHIQRPDKGTGCNVTTWQTNIGTWNEWHVKHNVFFEARSYGTFYPAITRPTIEERDFNYYYKSTVGIVPHVMYYAYDDRYTMAQFEDYQNAKKQDLNSGWGNRVEAQKKAREKVSCEDLFFLNTIFQMVDDSTLSGNAPSEFDLISPADGSSINGQVTLSWEASTGSTSPVDHYEVWIDCEHVASIPVGTNQYQAKLTNGAHNCFVIAVCQDGDYWRQSTTNNTFSVNGGIPSYSLIIESGTGSGNYIEEDTITISPDKLTGKTFKEWTGDTEYLISSVATANNNVVMPAKEITLTAVYEDILYTLTVENGSGSGTEYKYGQVVEITANEAPDGQVFTMWTGDTNYVNSLTIPVTTVTMPDGNVTVTATYKEDKPLFNWNMEAANIVLDEGEAKQDLTNSTSVITGGTEPNPPGYGSVGAIFNGTDQYLSLKNSDYGNRALNGTDRDGTIYVALKPSSISNHSFFWSLYSVYAGRQVALTLDHGKPAFYFGIQGGAHDNVELPHTFSAGDEIILALSLDAEAKNYTFMAKDISSNEYHSVTQSDKELSGIYNNVTVDLVIGGRSDLSSSWFFDGTIYWVRVYDELHSEEKMKKIIENSSRAEKSTEIDKSVTSNSFSVYPNPVQSEFTIYSTNGFEGNAKVEIYNQTGKRIYRSTGKVSFPHKVDVSSFNAGIYLVKVTDGNDQKTVKIMKQ